MYLDIKVKGNSKTVLLRESRREGKKIIKNTVANLSKCDPLLIKNIEKAIKMREIVFAGDIIDQIVCDDTVPWGHVEAVLSTMDRLGIPELIDPKPSDERNIVLGLVAARIIHPRSKYSTSLWWSSTSLASKLHLETFDEDNIYDVMDWLHPKQSEIEFKLAKRHLKDGDLAFIDMSSSYYEGGKSTLISQGDEEVANELSSLVRFGYSRDKKRGKAQINYSLLTDKFGRPISIEAFPGNTSDSTIFLPTVDKIKKEFNLSRVVMVGDRGMITSKGITILRQTDGVDWINALRSTSIKSIVPEMGFQFGLFDERNLCEFIAPDQYPGERLAACMNYELKSKREKTRESLIKKTSDSLDKIKARVESGRLKKVDAIALTVGRAINKCKVKKHFNLEIRESFFSYSLNEESINNEKTLDGVYVIRTSLPVEVMSMADCVRQYKNLSQVEQAFRTMKSVNLKVRPIYHRLDNRIRTHLFLTMLSYYVEWHMREAWRDLTFSDPKLAENKKTRDPINPAEKSDKAKKKSSSKMIDDSNPTKVHSFESILTSLGSISEVQLVLKHEGPDKPGIPFKRKKELTSLQVKAFDLLGRVPSYVPTKILI
jgi:transposase